VPECLLADSKLAASASTDPTEVASQQAEFPWEEFQLAVAASEGVVALEAEPSEVVVALEVEPSAEAWAAVAASADQEVASA